ncbi:MAG: hypothetical protein M3N19_08230 [Candidatus Eremiobacteraeota bacterium]|nr:hypothetical protein [Candidatus Eremiobacteraeota bacterium]
MDHQAHDDLDRLLFALPLEEPPHDLRAGILSQTIYRPSFPIKVWELWTIGVLSAVAVWLCVMIVQGGAQAFVSTFGLIATLSSRVLADSATWLWIAGGGGVAFLLMILNLSPMPVAAPSRVSRR